MCEVDLPPMHLQGPDALTTIPPFAPTPLPGLPCSPHHHGQHVAHGRTTVHHVMCSPDNWSTMKPTLHVRNFQCGAATVPWESCLPESVCARVPLESGRRVFQPRDVRKIAFWVRPSSISINAMRIVERQAPFMNPGIDFMRLARYVNKNSMSTDANHSKLALNLCS